MQLKVDGQLVLQFIRDYGPAALGWLCCALLLFGFLRVIFDEDQADLWRARIFKCLYRISKRRDHEKKYVSNDIRSRLNIARRALYCGHVILPKAVSIEWIQESDPSSYEVGEGEFVVCLDPASQQTENITHLARVVVERTSLLGVRHVMRQPLCTALDTALTRRLLYQLENQSPLDWFRSNIMQPTIERGGDLAEWTNKAVKIDEQGLLNTLLLVELEDFSRRIHGLERAPYMTTVVEGLVGFVYRLATKEVGIKIPLEFRRAHAHVGIVLVAKAETILEHGIERYIEPAKQYVERGIDTIYLILWEKKFLRDTRPDDYLRYNKRCKKLVQAIGKLPKVEEHFRIPSYEYIDSFGKPRDGSLVRYRVIKEQYEII